LPPADDAALEQLEQEGSVADVIKKLASACVRPDSSDTQVRDCQLGVLHHLGTKVKFEIEKADGPCSAQWADGGRETMKFTGQCDIDAKFLDNSPENAEKTRLAIQDEIRTVAKADPKNHLPATISKKDASRWTPSAAQGQQPNANPPLQSDTVSLNQQSVGDANPAQDAAAAAQAEQARVAEQAAAAQREKEAAEAAERAREQQLQDQLVTTTTEKVPPTSPDQQIVRETTTTTEKTTTEKTTTEKTTTEQETTEETTKKTTKTTTKETSTDKTNDETNDETTTQKKTTQKESDGGDGGDDS
jgi:hypothetical protein